MITALENFNTQKNTATFDAAEFKDTSILQGYLRRSRNDETKLEYVDFFSSILECFSRIRGMAETENNAVGYFEVKDYKSSLPLSIESIHQCIHDDKAEAPQELICVIAQKHFYLIKDVGESMRKILRRERNKVNIGRAQQMDSQCLIWLSKQPGYTTTQKAGSKQQVLAVVRHESYNTLENRVFKDFLRLCQREAKSYIDNYKEEYPRSKRVTDVKKLFNLVSSLLMIPEMSEISCLRSNPLPNYVLQKNKSYSTIWELYRMILNKYRLIEDLWPDRHIIIREYVAILIDDFLYYDESFKTALEGRYWVDAVNSKNKNGFLRNSNTLNYFRKATIGFSSLFFTDSKNNEVALKKSSSEVIRFPFYFIPHRYEDDDIVSYKIHNNACRIVVDERSGEKLHGKGIVTLSTGGRLLTDIPSSLAYVLRGI